MLDLDIRPKAEKNFYKILDYLEQKSPNGSLSVEQDILDAIEFLRENPLAGRARAELTSKNFRFWPVGNYWIVYEASEAILRIRLIIHAARNVSRLV